MTTLSYTVPVAGSTLNSIADPEVSTALTSIETWANGNIDSTNLAAATSQSASVNASGQVVKGVSNIATNQGQTNSTPFALLGTPDQVQNVVLASNGLIAVWFQATVNGAGSMALFLGTNQIELAGATAPAVQTLAVNTSGVATPVFTTPTGLAQVTPSSGYSGNVTTGQLIGGTAVGGGPCYIFAAAGTYTVSVQFKSPGTTINALNRTLWVQALSFA